MIRAMISKMMIATIGVISIMPILGIMRRKGTRMGSVMKSRKATIGLWRDMGNQVRIARIKIMRANA